MNVYLKYTLSIIFLACSLSLWAQHPCQAPEFRQFDFWVGEWEVYGLNGQKAGDSKISKILDECVILEEWLSASIFSGIRYAGKSYNKYNPLNKQWQQTWADNVGGNNEYLTGKYENKKIIIQSLPYVHNKDSMAIRKISFYDVNPNKVRQHGEVSFNEGKTWITEYDLDYRRKTNPNEAIVDSLLRGMMQAYNSSRFADIGSFYSKDAVVIGPGTFVSGAQSLEDYWKSFESMAGSWTLSRNEVKTIGNTIWASGRSDIEDLNGRTHSVKFSFSIVGEGDYWKIAQDNYWGVKE